MKKQRILKSEFEKFNELDEHLPYKVTCPDMFALAERFTSKEMALAVMEEARSAGHRAVLTFCNIARDMIDIIAYVGPGDSIWITD